MASTRSLRKTSSDEAPPRASGTPTIELRSMSSFCGALVPISPCPSAFFYIKDNKILASCEETSQAEADGRNLVLMPVESLDGNPSIMHRVDKADDTVRPRRMTITEILQTVVCSS